MAQRTLDAAGGVLRAADGAEVQALQERRGEDLSALVFVEPDQVARGLVGTTRGVGLVRPRAMMPPVEVPDDEIERLVNRAAGLFLDSREDERGDESPMPPPSTASTLKAEAILPHFPDARRRSGR